MARPERNDVDYFPHSVTHGKKMFYIRSKFGNDGYAVWFMLLENLGKASYHYLNLSDDVELMYLSSELKVADIVLTEIINELVKIDEFDKELWEENKILFNEKFVENVSDAYKKRNNKCIDRDSLLLLLQSKGIRKPSKDDLKPSKFTLKKASNTQSKVKDSKEKEIKEKEIKRKEYKPEFKTLFSKLKGRPNQEWISEMYEDRKERTAGHELTLQKYIDNTLMRSLHEFTCSCKVYNITFYSESGCVKYFKLASKGYITSADSWRKLLSKIRQRSEENISNIN